MVRGYISQRQSNGQRAQIGDAPNVMREGAVPPQAGAREEVPADAAVGGRALHQRRIPRGAD